ncbi:Hmgb3, partial [Symbiodinium natans]
VALRAEPAPLKRPPTAYFLWLAENRPRIKESLGEEGRKVTEVSKAAGKEWKKLTAKAKKKYVEEAEKLKADYLVQKAATESTSESAARKDPSLPKRPKNAYMLWLQEHRKDIAKSLGPNHQPKEVMVEAGRMWRSFSDAEKKPYVAQASKLKKAYEKQVR